MLTTQAEEALSRPCLDSFVNPNPYRQSDPVLVMKEFREGVESLPETSATFLLSNVLDNYTGHQVSDDMVTLVGSWEASDMYTRTSGVAQRYVNPGHPDRRLFSDVYVECECGAFMAREKRIKGTTVSDEDHQHTDECRKSWRLRARADLCDRRAEILEEVLTMGLSANSAARRLALTARGSGPSIGSISEKMSLPTQEWKRSGRELRINTEAALLAKGYSCEEVGALWGVTAGTIRERIATRTEFDVSELRDNK